ncbi:hypothetical protein EGH24_06335 [Halonotius terrestris]|uniref:Uncharacterized protein n=1 Tax=Halonotius terrestris TaxID=2487750 RepID=A0A8J8PAT1_9EURY|nr:hypothetical protein [Halonotius terrestris]TQQ83046.1 hypothetical protein EGH24_06335 [Halonotius terrestris]
MTNGIKILDGISEWVRERMGPDAENRVDEQPDNGDSSAGPSADDEESSDRDSPACCSASGNTDVTVFDS